MIGSETDPSIIRRAIVQIFDEIHRVPRFSETLFQGYLPTQTTSTSAHQDVFICIISSASYICINLVQTEDASLLRKRNEQIRTLNSLISRVGIGKEQLPHGREQTIVRLRRKIQSLEKLSARGEPFSSVSSRHVTSYLAALAAESAAESTLDPPAYDVDPDHEMSGFIHFKSEEEVKDLERGIRRRIRRTQTRPSLPMPPNISDEEFERIQKRVTRKTEGDTLTEYCIESKLRHAIPDEILEATAEDLLSEDEFVDDTDSRSESDEELPARTVYSDNCGRISRIDFVPIANDENAVPWDFNKSPTEDSTIRSRIGSSTTQVENPVTSSEPAHVEARSSRQFLYNEEDSLISGFHPKSCSTSIGHDSLNQSRVMDFEDIPKTAPGNTKRPCDRTIMPHADSPSSSSSDSTLESFGESPEAIHSDHSTSPQVTPSRTATGRMSLDRTPSTMMRQCNLGSNNGTGSWYSCPDRQSRVTPIAKRLRRLGLVDSSCSADSHTPKRRKLATAKRFLQVYGTPQRNSSSFERFFSPTADLAELVKFRVVQTDPFRMNFALKPARLEDRF